MRKCAFFFALLITTLFLDNFLLSNNENLKPYTIVKNKEEKQKLVKKDSLTISKKKKETLKA